MRTDDTYFKEKQQAAQHGGFKLPENEGKEYIDNAKKSPTHYLEGPISVQLKLHIQI